MAYSLPQSRILFSDAQNARELSERRDELVEAMTKATAEGFTGHVTFGAKDDYMPIPAIVRDSSKVNEVRKALDDLSMSKMAKGTAEYGDLVKEWSLTNPLSTGLGYGAAA